MKRTLLLIAIFFFSSVAQAHDPKVPLDNYQKQFLTQYELMRVALFNDDLDSAKKAAEVIVENTAIQNEAGGDTPHGFVKGARDFVNATSLAAARDIFRFLSFYAIKFTDNTPGYYLMYCRLEQGGKGGWVQTSKEVGNPYSGKTAHPCGESQNIKTQPTR